MISKYLWKFLVLISNTVNTRCNLHREKLFGILSDFYRHKGAQDPRACEVLAQRKVLVPQWRHLDSAVAHSRSALPPPLRFTRSLVISGLPLWAWYFCSLWNLTTRLYTAVRHLVTDQCVCMHSLCYFLKYSLSRAHRKSCIFCVWVFIFTSECNVVMFTHMEVAH